MPPIGGKSEALAVIDEMKRLVEEQWSTLRASRPLGVDRQGPAADASISQDAYHDLWSRVEGLQRVAE